MNAFLTVPVLVGTLGYFVDVFDLMIFSVVRPESLTSLGVPMNELLPVGARLLNYQTAGLLVGGFLWGMVSDRRGRRLGLYGSILLYSLANVANALVTSPEQYAFCRLLAGLGLAGELGVAVTLVCESLPTRLRSHGTMLVVGVGLFGAVLAAFIGDRMPWRAAYFAGGAMGLVLLSLRLSLKESPLYLSQHSQSRGSLRLLLSSGKRARAYVGCVLMGLPIWFVIAILATFGPELGRDLGLGTVSPGASVLSSSLGVTAGNFLFGYLSLRLRSRRRAIALGLIASTALLPVLLWLPRVHPTPAAWQVLCFTLALTTGYGGVLFTMAAEQFGTNLRALAASSIPNLVRGSSLITVPLFLAARGPFGATKSALAVGLLCLAAAALPLPLLEETYDRDLDYSDA